MDQTVAKGVGYLFLAHAGSRAITFLLNQALLRYLTPAGLGASVRYELFLTTILYFTRDNVRLASQRLDYGEQEAINMAYLSIPAGILLCYAIGTLSTGWPVRKPNWNVSSLLLYGCAAVIELLSEPAYAVIQQRQLLRVRALAEGIGSIFRGSVAFVFAYLLNRIGRELSAAPLAVAQIIYSICLFITYTWSVTHLPPGNFSLLLRRTSSSDDDTYILQRFPKSLCLLAATFTLQSVVKYVLTYGDGIIISAFATLEQQGTYALSANYGGLVARMIFLPIEETARLAFVKYCTFVTNNDTGELRVAEASDLLHSILKLYFIMSLLAVTAGPRVCPILLRAVAGKSWASTEVASALTFYCYYIPLLAFNGLTEAFVSAVAETRDVNRQSLYMGLFFLAFATVAYITMRTFNLGAKGVIVANGVSMSLRLLWSLRYIQSYLRQRGLELDIRRTLPNMKAISFAVVLLSLNIISPSIQGRSFSVRGASLLLLQAGVLSLAILLAERNFLQQLVDSVSGTLS